MSSSDSPVDSAEWFAECQKDVSTLEDTKKVLLTIVWEVPTTNANGEWTNGSYFKDHFHVISIPTLHIFLRILKDISKEGGIQNVYDVRVDVDEEIVNAASVMIRHKILENLIYPNIIRRCTDEELVIMNLPEIWETLYDGFNDDGFNEPPVPIEACLRMGRYDVFETILAYLPVNLANRQVNVVTGRNDEKAFDILSDHLGKNKDSTLFLCSSLKHSFQYGIEKMSNEEVNPGKLMKTAVEIYNFELIDRCYNLLPFCDIVYYAEFAVPNMHVVKLLLKKYRTAGGKINITNIIIKFFKCHPGHSHDLEEFLHPDPKDSDDPLIMNRFMYNYEETLKHITPEYIKECDYIRDPTKDFYLVRTIAGQVAIADKYGIPHGRCEPCYKYWYFEHTCPKIPCRCGKEAEIESKYCEACRKYVQFYEGVD